MQKSAHTFDTNGDPWFVAMDICDALEIGNPSQALSRLDDDEKADVVLTDTSSNGVIQQRNMSILTESGMHI